MGVVDNGSSRKSAKALVRLLYRGILRWAGQYSNVPFAVQQTHVAELVPFLDISKRNVLNKMDGSSAVRYLARCGFERYPGKQPLGTVSSSKNSSSQFEMESSSTSRSTSSSNSSGNITTSREKKKMNEKEDGENAIDRGILALKLLNTRYRDVVEHMLAVRREKMDRTGIEYGVGQVFRHKVYGYKGVIYGFDRRCERDAEWIAQMGVKDAEVPFYFALPDEFDCQRLFGGVRLTKYVSQDNIDPLEDGRVVHRALDNYFVGYSERLKRYIPVKRLQFEYPDDAYGCGEEDADLRPVKEDADLLSYPDEMTMMVEATDEEGRGAEEEEKEKEGEEKNGGKTKEDGRR